MYKSHNLWFAKTYNANILFWQLGWEVERELGKLCQAYKHFIKSA